MTILCHFSMHMSINEMLCFVYQGMDLTKLTKVNGISFGAETKIKSQL